MGKKYQQLLRRADECLNIGKGSPNATPGPSNGEAWKVIIADDEREVHSMTRIVLGDYTFEDRGLNFLSAYSGAQTLQLIEEHPDTAVILLDVVMETDDSGLEVVRRIRETLKNEFVRIILRTGQPGKAPETQVIAQYDINDYKEKTELTAQKLFTTITAALRAYRDLRIIEQNRRGLEKIIDASADLFELRSLRQFAQGVLTQLLSLLHLDESSLLMQASAFTASRNNDDFIIIAATGQYEDTVGQPVKKVVPEHLRQHVIRAMQAEQSLFVEDMYIGYFATRLGSRHLLFLKGCRNLTELDQMLINIFASNIAIAFENIALNQEIVDTQKEVIFTLGEVIETRSQETGNHVRRVAELSYLLALKAGLSEKEAELIRLASPMHDVGKVGIPDAILFKPARLSLEEFELIKHHTDIGYEILKNSNREIMLAAVLAALQHHERWDGGGYPKGLKGEDIHIYGRITALADVFDALLHARIYKEAWEREKVLDFIQKERGKQFDPRLADILLENRDEFFAIIDRYPDEGRDRP
ncbi:MAG: DUF3369 domain-containing protein [Desulfobacterales bacterium]|nr:MAG: DUF3369 domain-containing protein [Desulfobacterales bacterium]